MSDLHSGSHKLETSMDNIMQTLLRYKNDMPDLVVQRFSSGSKDLVISYLSSITDIEVINKRILAPLLEPLSTPSETEPKVWLEKKQTDEWEMLTSEWASGFISVIYEGEATAYLYDVKKFPKRQPEEPSAETASKGNHLGFIESFDENLAMIRSFLNDGQLVCRTFVIGSRVKTTCGLLYLKDVVNQEWIDVMTRRVEGIKADAIYNIGILQESVEDTLFSIFPQFVVTERPDITVAHLLQGRVALLLDKTSGAVIGPTSFENFFQSIDDYALRWPVASFIRMLRAISFLIAVYLPSVYIAALTFHYEIIPIDLLISIGRSREKVPIPPILEAFIMEIVLEMLREAGLRLPSKVGQTVGIVGGIVIGQAAVQAGIVSNIMVVVVSFTAVASFIQPQQDMAAAIRLLRFPYMILAYLFGAVGIVCGMMVLASHIISLQTLRSPYGSPISPLHPTEWKDMFVRLPYSMLRKRPVSLRAKEKVRQQKP